MKVADMHCDTVAKLIKHPEWSLSENGLHINLDKMQAGDYLLQNFALFVYTKSGRDPFEEAMEMADCFEMQMRRFPEKIGQVKSFADIEKNRAVGKISAMLTLEEGAVCKGSLENLRKFYERGVRMMTLTWNFPNEIGYPNILGKEGEKPDFTKPQTEKGLTEFGICAVEEMQRMGMIVDVSHLSDAGFWDVARHTKKPFVASHSNARAVCNQVRNLTDEMIRTLGERGGVTGLNFCADFLETAPMGVQNKGTIEAVVRHAKHIADKGGVDCLGLGSDFDGIPTHEQLDGADKLPLLDAALEKGGFSASQREKIYSGNVLRVYKELL